MNQLLRFIWAGAVAASPFLAAAQLRGAEGNNAVLPITDIVLYTSGVGFFERRGEVEGRAELELRFKTEDINDLLKSLVIQDPRSGAAPSVVFGSQDPVTRTLRSFAVDLTENPTLGQLLNQVRGERVEVFWPNAVTGTILGVETKTRKAENDQIVELEFLNLVSPEGLQSIPLAQVQRIKLLDQHLNAELNQALAVLAASHDTRRRTVTIQFEGEGARPVRVGYVAQTPVWKTSYRLLLGEERDPFLQGWAIVENTSDEDWRDVRLALVSGRPISFVMDLYQPLYVTRPTVQLELYTSLRPPVYGGAMHGELTPPAMTLQMGRQAAPSVASRSGLDLMEAKMESQMQMLAASAPQEWDFQSAAGAAAGAQTGELFQYEIRIPVTLPRQKSALLPILNEDVSGRKVSIYNESVQPRHPLNGLRLKNSTALHLMQGPITVFDGNAYAGDARIEDLAPGEERLISYGLDLNVEVVPDPGSGRQELVSVQIRRGTLLITREAIEEKSYAVRNRGAEAKTVILEHPLRGDWNLAQPVKADEQTRNTYRFELELPAHSSDQLMVREQKQLEERIELINFARDGILFYLRAPRVSPRVREALEQVVALRDRLHQTGVERAGRERQVTEITQEQARIRENMSRLDRTSELYLRYVKNLDQQETELETLRREIQKLRETENRQKRELDEFLLNLEVS